MGNIAIITDSIACLTREMVEKYGIKVLPSNILFEGEVYREGIDLSASEAYQLLEKAPNHFCTASPSAGDFLESFYEANKWASAILCITLSRKFSTLHDEARVAREQIREELPQVAIEVLDSQTACAAEGLIVLAAARAAAKGKKLDEIIKIAEGVRERMNLIVLMETIRHVYRTGRIPKAAAEIGSMLKVKPILTVPDGAAHLAGMVRTQDSGVKRMLAMMRKKVGTSPVHVAVTHANALEEGKKLKEQISSEFNCVDLWLTEFSPIMGYATGPGVLGVAFYSED